MATLEVVKNLKKRNYDEAVKDLFDIRKGTGGAKLRFRVLRQVANDLDELAQVLNGLEEALDRYNRSIGKARHNGWHLDELIDMITDGERLLWYEEFRLPHYGGKEPEELLNVYGWDESRLLMNDMSWPAPWVLVKRDWN